MKLSKLFLSVVCVCAIITTANVNAQTKVKFNTEKDSIGYALGLTYGKSLLEYGVYSFIETAPFTQGFLDAMANSPAQLPQEQLSALMEKLNQKMGALQQEQQAAQAAEDAKAAVANKEIGQKFLAENKKRPGVKTTASGLQYEVISEGKGRQPAATNKVKVHYHGTTIDGTVFDSSVERGEPIEFPLSGVIPGWTEGLQLMKEGAKYKFFIPSDLAYGDRSPAPQIKAGSTLIFEVELIQVID